jgi:cytochrome c oxidase subunit 2
MSEALPLLLPAAAAQAHEWNWLSLALILLSGGVVLAVFALIVLFAVRYRRGRAIDRSGWVRRTTPWEIGWTSATCLAFILLFAWGADLFLRMKEPPANAMQIFVVGKQWMWKIEHPGGQREIDTLHLPLGIPVRLVLGSEDVIHSFHIPAFRLTQDAVPGRFTELAFTPDQLGRFHLFCTEFCGTEHAAMGGAVIVMTKEAYQAWLASQPPEPSLARQGEALYRAFGCSGCHGANAEGQEGSVRAPPLRGVYGRAVPLSDGRTIKADERYLRDSILLPRAEIVAGYAPIMPSFSGQIDEEDLVKLIAFLESLDPPASPEP